MLEQYVGSRVVMEIMEEDEIHEHVGVLKDYSAEFLELLDVYFPMPQKVKLDENVQCDVYEKVIGLDHERGRVAPGFVADLVLLSPDLRVRGTIVEGKIVYHNRLDLSSEKGPILR